MRHFQGLLFMSKQSFTYCDVIYMTVPWEVVLALNNVSFISKIASSKPKNCITNWLKRVKKEKDKKIEEEP